MDRSTNMWTGKRQNKYYFLAVDDFCTSVLRAAYVAGLSRRFFSLFLPWTWFHWTGSLI